MSRIKDGDWTLYDYDFQTGRSVWLRQNGDGTDTWRTDYPVEQSIKENRDVRNSVESGWKGDYHRVASIPLNIFHAELAEASRQDDQRYISRWLNDSDRRAWRTKEGNV